MPTTTTDVNVYETPRDKLREGHAREVHLLEGAKEILTEALEEYVRSTKELASVEPQDEAFLLGVAGQARHLFDLIQSADGLSLSWDGPRPNPAGTHHAEATYAAGRYGWHCLTCGAAEDETLRSLSAADEAVKQHEAETLKVAGGTP